MPTNTTEPTRRRPRGWLIAATAVVAVVGLVFALGGFDRRQARWIDVPPGAEIDAGNLVFTFDSATVQYLTKTSSQPWRVVVSGTVRNPHDQTLQPLTGDYGNLVGINRTGSPDFVGDWQPRIGPFNPDSATPRQVVPPNDQTVPLTATFRFDQLTPGDSFELGVSPMEYTATAILGLNSELRWNRDSYTLPFTVVLPLTRLPDADY